MDINQLKYFRMVVQCESLTEAANMLHITQSALSKVIARLEAELGIRLFDRGYGKLQLNTNGARFLQYADMSLNALDVCIEQMTMPVERGISIAYTKSFDISAEIELCQTYYPELELTGEILAPGKCWEQMESKKSNVAVFPMPDEMAVSWEPIYKEKWCVICHARYPLDLKRSIINLSELENVPAVFYGDPETFGFILRVFENQQLEPNFILHTIDGTKTAPYINRGLAVGIAPYHFFYKLKQQTPDIPINAAELAETDLSRTVYISKNDTFPKGKKAEECYERLNEEIRRRWTEVDCYMKDYLGK